MTILGGLTIEFLGVTVGTNRLPQGTPPVTLTNTTGELFTLRLTSSGLQIQTPDHTGFPCWTIFSANDENNEPLDLSQTSGWMYSPPGSGSLIQAFFLAKSSSALNLELACPPSFTTQFFVLPQP